MKKKYLLGGLLLAVFTYQCTSLIKGPEYYDPPTLATHFEGGQFVGSETCKECHADIYASHLQTAHYHTSAPATAENIKGSFQSGSNKLKVEEVEFEMVQEGNSFYQQTNIPASNQKIPPQKFDLVIGSGVNGQSYLTWEKEYLFQLQASYYPPTNSWINSPGYPPQPIKRPIRDGCLKCHVTFATNRDFSGQGNQYDREKMVYRIDCERCHNPAKSHVVYHRENPDAEEPAFILTYDTLSRERRLDACAQCHSGPRDGILKGNSFSYQVGEKLDEYSRNFYTGVAEKDLDVHGNQYGLLTSSKCFQQSPNLECVSCHNPHANQRGNTAQFIEKCLSCHTANTVLCTAESSVRNTMENNCIACHMPSSPSQSMTVQLDTDSTETSVFIRTHRIGIYPKEKWHH